MAKGIRSKSRKAARSEFRNTIGKVKKMKMFPLAQYFTYPNFPSLLLPPLLKIE